MRALLLGFCLLIFFHLHAQNALDSLQQEINRKALLMQTQQDSTIASQHHLQEKALRQVAKKKAQPDQGDKALTPILIGAGLVVLVMAGWLMNRRRKIS